jgi:hypothetical protein
MNTMFFLPVAISLSVVFLLPVANKKFRARLARDPVTAIMFGVAAVLGFAILASAAIVARTHNIEIIKIPMLAAGVFAIVGIVLGVVRNLPGKLATKAIDRTN